ncbi:hypothetical protein ACNTMW_23125 [Planosporangium sp. 12N6]|uniref:hypothetical protein n=1 Tax=Planosporangium spinosum TaxID=3402278 RepID=UPI003CE92C05
MSTLRGHCPGLSQPGARAVVMLLVTVASGCTPADRSDQRTRPPAVSSSSPVAGPSPSGRYLVAPPRLSCEDAATGVTTPSANLRRFNGLASDGWPESVRQPTANADGDRATFWKAFLYVTADAARWTTVTVAQPTTASLYYVPFPYWSSASTDTTLGTEDPASGRRAITFESCPQQPLGYTGGVTTREPACVVLTVHADGRQDATVRLPLGVPC